MATVADGGNKRIERKAGRPPKFGEESRPITVTLPERVLQALNDVGADRAKAIVRCVDTFTGHDARAEDLVQLVEVLEGKALIVIRHSRLLMQIPWLRQVEVAPGRCLLVLPSGTSTESLEVEIRDLLAGLGSQSRGEKLLLDQLAALLAQSRRKQTISKAELVFIDVRPQKKAGRQLGGIVHGA